MSNNKFVPTQYQDAGAGDTLNLVNVVTDVLTHQKHPDPTGWKKDLHPDVASGQAANEHVRHLVNRAIRMRLADSQEDTTVERGFLINQGPDFAWVGLFARAVAPTMVRLGV